MAIVSISKAGKITGKARSTIQRYIKTGKISTATDPTTGKEGIDTSELVRVFGVLFDTGDTPASNKEMIQRETPSATSQKDIEIIQLKAEISKLHAVVKEKSDHIDSLNNAMRLLEYQRQKPPDAAKKEESKGFFKRLFNK